ncbi:hypothetical protein NC652_035301 [Populus alba x Populus x berolinensis]|nr:hypothetical protein NC652_035301 [Populus alba x Populus x berolinensis]
MQPLTSLFSTGKSTRRLVSVPFSLLFCSSCTPLFLPANVENTPLTSLKTLYNTRQFQAYCI